MILQIHGTGTHNKGAELMAIAILQHYRRLPEPPEFAVTPHFGTYPDRAKYGLWTIPHARRWGRSKLAIHLMNPAFRRTHGLVREEETTAVIDASGFAFGDQHGPRPTQTMVENCRRWRKQGKKIVLLPQAFGPFTSQEIRQACRELVGQCDLVFAREETSYRHLVDVAGPQPHIRQAPDFTNLVEGCLPEGFEAHDDTALVVPNMRMLDKTTEATRRNYLPFMARVVDALAQADLRPIVLLHTLEDERLVEPLQELARYKFATLRETCPVRLKGILGTARLVVSSRFHALVGALSQAVPALACGWSHKYDELLADYNCPEGVLAVKDGDRLPEKLAPFVHSPQRDEIIARLQSAGQRLRERVNDMWATVDQTLGISLGHEG